MDTIVTKQNRPTDKQKLTNIECKIKEDENEKLYAKYDPGMHRFGKIRVSKCSGLKSESSNHCNQWR